MLCSHLRRSDTQENQQTNESDDIAGVTPAVMHETPDIRYSELWSLCSLLGLLRGLVIMRHRRLYFRRASSPRTLSDVCLVEGSWLIVESGRSLAQDARNSVRQFPLVLCTKTSMQGLLLRYLPSSSAVQANRHTLRRLLNCHDRDPRSRMDTQPIYAAFGASAKSSCQLPSLYT
jgi:hypothetical protein